MFGGGVYFLIRNIRDTSKLFKVVSPVQYAEFITDSDIDQINDKIWVNLVYRGLNEHGSVVLEIE
jgi:hypothetical protein